MDRFAAQAKREPCRSAKTPKPAKTSQIVRIRAALQQIAGGLSRFLH